MKYLLSGLLLYFFIVPKTGYPLPTIIGQRPTTNDQRPMSNGLNRTAFYKAMEENNKELVNAQLAELQSVPEDIRDAFTGAMTMKKASFGGPPAIKLKLFKQGRKLLETAIKKDPDNAEYRFLRLIVQEHAPGVLGYNKDLENDGEYIKKSYKSLPDDLQHIIADYRKKSKALKLQVS